MLTDEQKRMKKVVEHLQLFMNTYSNQRGYLSCSDSTLINDVLYGLGIALNSDEYVCPKGFRRFKKVLREYVLTKEELKILELAEV